MHAEMHAERAMDCYRERLEIRDERTLKQGEGVWLEHGVVCALGGGNKDA